jgi:hypothetical protein
MKLGSELVRVMCWLLISLPLGKISASVNWFSKMPPAVPVT